MNEKVYLVFILVLLTNSGFGQDLDWIIPDTDSITLPGDTRSKTTESTTDSDSTDSITIPTEPIPYEDPEFEDEVGGDKGLIIVANIDSNLFAICNVTARAGLIIDLNADLIALVNGTSPTAIVIDVNERTGVYVSTNSIIIKEESFRVFLSSLNHGLKPFLSLEKAIRFRLEDASAMILESVNGILEKLQESISAELKRNPKEGLELFVAIGTELLRLNKGPLKGHVEILGIRGITLPGGIARAYNVMNGLAAILSRVPGGFSALVEAGAPIQLQKYADARNGLEALAEIIRQIDQVENIGKILGDLINDPESLLKLINLLSGNHSNGVSGVLKVIAAAARLAKDERNLEYVINVILQFLAVNNEKENDPEEISSQFKQGITDLLKAIDDAQSTEALSEGVKVLRLLKEGRLQLNKVKVSQLVSILISAIDKPKKLQFIVDVLLELREIIEIEESIPRLLVVLILNVDSPLGIEILERVGISIDTDRSEISGSILERILKSVSDFISRISRDLYEGLCSVPALERIVISIESAISESRVDKDMKELLRINEAAKILIKAVLQVVGNVPLEVPDQTCSRVRDTVQSCSSASFYLNIEVNVTVSE